MATNFTVVDHYPARDASGVYINDVIWAQFSEELYRSQPTLYANFSVFERDDLEPVEGNVVIQGVSGGLNDAVTVFIPTNYLKRNTRYTVMASTGLTNKNQTKNLDSDYIWYFETGNVAQSGNIGDNVYDLDPTGVTAATPAVSGLVSGSVALSIVSTSPSDYTTNVSRDLQHIAIEFSHIVPSSLLPTLYDNITITEGRVLG